MRLAVAAARRAAQKGGAAIGALIVDGRGRVLFRETAQLLGTSA
jgi:tRNA(Arg) A34 adenosine deaminase TadA